MPFRDVLNWGQATTVVGVHHADMLPCVLQSEFGGHVQIPGMHQFWG